MHGRTAVMTIYDDKKNVIEKVDLHLIKSKTRLHEIMREKGFELKSGEIINSRSNRTSMDLAESLLYSRNVPEVPTETIVLLRIAILGVCLFIMARFYKFCKIRQSRKSS